MWLKQLTATLVQAPLDSCHNVTMAFLRKLFREIWRRVRYLFGRFSADRCSENAAALTYMSLFALVPLLTVLYTMASAIPAFQGAEEQMQTLLFKHLVPSSSSDIEHYLNDFSQQAKNLTGPGVGFLLVTAILMLRNIEHAFNMIWRARRKPQRHFQFPAVLGGAEPGAHHHRPGTGPEHLPLHPFAHALDTLQYFRAPIPSWCSQRHWSSARWASAWSMPPCPTATCRSGMP